MNISSIYKVLHFRMSLCIVGSESLDQMEAYLGTLGFDAIENKDVVPKEWLYSPYEKEQLGKRVEVNFFFISQ